MKSIKKVKKISYHLLWNVFWVKIILMCCMENIRCDVRYNVKCHVKIYKVTFWYIKIEMFLEHLMQMLLISIFFFII